MKLHSLLLGKYNRDQYFNLYCFENSSTLLFKFSDISFLFKLPTHLLNKEVHSYKDKYSLDTYLTTTVLTQLAIKHNKFLLAELCKLKQNDYIAHLDKSILSKISELEYLKSNKNNYTTTNIQLQEDSSSIVKSEPTTPPPIPPSNSDPMALNSLLIGAGSQQEKRPNRISDDQPNNKKQKNSHTLLPKPVHTVNSQKSSSTLLSKRLVNGNSKNTRNLTIYAPSYAEQFNGIRSAPLNGNFRVSNTKQPHPLSKPTMISPASSATNSEFAIPPIVPSQQQPPHTAHPSSLNRPHSPQYPSSAYGHSFPMSSRADAFPKTPTGSLQRQQFLQPFEHLFDTIETTRTLKSTLDDQIRRSSSLIQTLQASSTTIEGLVRNQVKEAQKEIMQRTEETIRSLANRIAKLENKRVTPQEEKKVEEDLMCPPTIVRSQNDIAPNEYVQMLDTLRERLDKLERQFDS